MIKSIFAGMDEQRKSIGIALLLGIFLFPLLGIMDAFVYPKYLYDLLLIRALITFYLALVFFFLRRFPDRYIFWVTFLFFLLGSFAISSMCYVTGDGFNSPYYAGHFIVIIIATIFFTSNRNYYAAIVIACLVQHFCYLSTLPWTPAGLAKNIFFLGSVVFCGFIVRIFIHRLITEIRTLKGIIPICASCKKVRDDQGFWLAVEQYFAEHSDVDFTHSFCPECAKKLYGVDT